MQEATEQAKIDFQNDLYDTALDFTPVIRAIERGYGFSPRWPVLGRLSLCYIDTIDVYSILIDSCQDHSKAPVPIHSVTGPDQFDLLYGIFEQLNGHQRQGLIRLLHENETEKVLVPVFGVSRSGVYEIDRDLFLDALIAQEFEAKDRTEQHNKYYEFAF
jgi:hypothetical protein